MNNKILDKKNYNQLIAFAISCLAILLLSFGHMWGNNFVLGDGYLYGSALDYKFLLVSMSLALFLPFLFFMTRNESYIIKLNNTKLTFFLFFILGVFSYFWVYDLSLYLRKLFLFLVAVALFIVASKFSTNKRFIEYFALLATFCVFGVSLIGITQYFFSFPSPEYLSQVVSPASTFGNKNLATHLLVLLLPMPAYLFFSKNNFVKVFFSFLSLLTGLIYIYLPLTKFGWVAVGVQCLFFLIYLFFKSNRKNVNFSKNQIISSISLVLIFISISFFNNSPLNEDSNFDKFNAQMSSSIAGDQSRFAIYSGTLDMIYQAPFLGHGLGSWSTKSIDAGFQHLLRRSHNDLLELVTELGLIGFSLFIMFVFFLIRDWIVINQKSSNSLFYDFSTLALAGIFIQMQFTFPFQLITGFVISGIYVGLISAKAQTYKVPFYRIKISDSIKKVLLIVLALIFIAVSYITNEWFKANDNAMINSGTNYTKFNKQELLNLPKYPFQDQEFFNFYNSYLDAGYDMRAYELLEITNTRNPRNIYSQRKAFEILLKEKNFVLAKKYLREMIEYHEFSGVTLISELEFGKYTKNFKYSLDAYTKHKKKLISTPDYKKQLNVIKYLLQWSVTLQQYQDTELLYDIYVNKYADNKNDEIEYAMAKFYAYNGNLDDGYRHYSFVIERNEELIDEQIKNFYTTSTKN